MKTMILYATKHGAAYEIAQRIAGRISGSVVYDLKQNNIPPLTQFDCIIIGSSLYAGMIQKEAKEFLSKNADVLCSRRLGLFLSGIDASKEETYFETNFPQDILQAAAVKSFLGGIFDPKKAGRMERLIMKMIAKQSKYMSNIFDDKIKQFTETITMG